MSVTFILLNLAYSARLKSIKLVKMSAIIELQCQSVFNFAKLSTAEILTKKLPITTLVVLAPLQSINDTLWTNFRYQDETLADVSSVEVNCLHHNYVAIKQNIAT
jgi:hypothetical protein